MKSTFYLVFLALLCATTLASTCSSQDTYLDELRSKAETGDAAAQFWLGEYYQDPQTMMTNHPELASNPPNYPEALKWLAKSAAQGEPKAMTALAEMFADGAGVPQNGNLAVIFYRMSCGDRSDYQGASHACNDLAVLYDDGHVVNRDPVEAAKFYILAGHSPDNAKEITNLTAAQIADAEARVQEWWREHPIDMEVSREQHPENQ